MKLPDVARRAGWSVTDQAISSGTNAALSILVARSVGAVDFGGFAVAFIVFSVCVGVSRALTTSPLGIRFAGVPDAEFHAAARAGTGSALGLGVVAGVGALVAGQLVEGPAGTALTALALLLPALLLQDAWRITFFAQARPAKAAFNDLVWAVAQLGLVAVLLHGGYSTVGPFVVAWGAAAAVAAVVGVAQSRIVPAPQATVSWLRRHFDLTRYLVAEFGTLQAFSQATMLAISIIASVEVIGALRGAEVLLGPATLLSVSIYNFALPEFSRRRDVQTGRGWLRGAGGVSAVMVLAAITWGLVFVLLPSAAGEALLGQTWSHTHDVLVPGIVGQVGAALSLGPAVMLYAMDRAKVTMRIHATMAPLMVTFGIGGVLIAGAQGAAWGLAAAFWAVLPQWWFCVRREAAAMERQRLAAAREGQPAATA